MFSVYLFIFLLGLIVGSFLNVVIYRYNTGRGVARGRSQCFSCSHTLSWYELVPLFSFLLQGGRCRVCQSRISWQYPLVELVSGGLFVLIFQHFLGNAHSLPLFFLNATIWSLLLVITVYDLRHKIIPDGLVYAFIIFSLISAGVSLNWAIFSNHLLAGLVLFLFFFAFWWLSAGRWMGFGDAKLALGVGFLLGLSAGISAIVLAFWFGAVISVLLLIAQRLWRGRSSFTMKSEIPFAPFIILGTALSFFCQFHVFSLFNF